MCGVVGIYAPGYDVSRLAYFALYALQHRGQESAGIGVADGTDVVIHREQGLVNQVFDEGTLQALKGHAAIGHVRYRTQGDVSWKNGQPFFFEGTHHRIALAHNGEVQIDGPPGYSDSYILAREIANSPGDIRLAVTDVLSRVKGAYAIVVMTPDQMVVARDPQGLRPLSIGDLNGGWAAASESCALDIAGCSFIRELAPGEVVSLSDNGVRSYHNLADEWEPPRTCIFEHIYFARPDSYIDNERVYDYRWRMGQELWLEDDDRFFTKNRWDIVVPVPDSGIPAAEGFAYASGSPLVNALIKNRYVNRTFIEPTQEQRQLGIRLKFNVLSEAVAGKSVVLVDDSIVRGNTIRALVKLLREAGAREVHVRIPSPPVIGSCEYGIDMREGEQLAGLYEPSERASKLDCDSLRYLSWDGLYRALNGPQDRQCENCFCRSESGDWQDPGSKWNVEADMLDGLPE